ECASSNCLDGVDVVFSVLHGFAGEDGMMQALLEASGIKYTGSKVLASALAMDKVMSKIMLLAAGVPTPEWTTVRATHEITDDLLKEIRADFRLGMVVKPNDQGSTVGMTIVKSGNLDDIENAIRLALQYSNVALIENYIEGRELTVAVLGSEALPIVEIIPDGGFYDYAHKYTKGMSEYMCPAEMDEEVAAFVQQLAVTSHKVLGCSGYSRVDFRLDEENHPWCLEVNTLPGMTATSLVPKAAAAAGIEFADLCERIIELS
ncbi:MAG: D-alanine--D-alanine ligase, partial [Candidatus Kapabacteria bacterium]|nr:D-alanine--D-alanine ligase [Candidatus Kapabacteria bacterium]